MENFLQHLSKNTSQLIFHGMSYPIVRGISCHCVALRQHRMQRNDFYRENRSFLKSLNMLGSEAAVSIPDSVADNAEQGE